MLKRAESAFYTQPKGIPRYLGNTFSILSYAFQQQTLLKISEIFDIVRILRSKIYKMAKRMTVQEVLDEIVAHQDSGDLDFDDESGDCFIANSSALTHIYPFIHIGVVKLRARGVMKSLKKVKLHFCSFLKGHFTPPKKP